MCRRDHTMTAGICPDCGLRSAIETDLLFCKTEDNTFVENKGYCLYNRNPEYNLKRQIAPGGILSHSCRRCESEISWWDMMRAEEFIRRKDPFSTYVQNTHATWPDYAWQNRPYDPEAFQAVLPRDTTHETDKDYIPDEERIYHARLKQYQHRQLQEEQETQRSARPQNQLRASWPVIPYDHANPGPVYEEDHDPGFTVQQSDFDDVVYWNPNIRPGPLTQVAGIEAQARAAMACLISVAFFPSHTIVYNPHPDKAHNSDNAKNTSKTKGKNSKVRNPSRNNKVTRNRPGARLFSKLSMRVLREEIFRGRSFSIEVRLRLRMGELSCVKGRWVVGWNALAENDIERRPGSRRRRALNEVASDGRRLAWDPHISTRNPAIMQCTKFTVQLTKYE